MATDSGGDASSEMHLTHQKSKQENVVCDQRLEFLNQELVRVFGVLSEPPPNLSVLNNCIRYLGVVLSYEDSCQQRHGIGMMRNHHHHHHQPLP
ncbi:hypothetical protein M0804_007513 [Polistes exclamans]|nr:hypothetical protein M0804_007513 [Polistes exclamans]